MSTKLLILSLLFVVSAGTFAAERFRKNKTLVVLALLISVASTYYLYRSILDDFEDSTAKATFDFLQAVDGLSETNEKITAENEKLSEQVAQLQSELTDSLAKLEAASSETIDSGEFKSRRLLFLQELREGITRESLVAIVGDPDRRRRIGSSQFGTSMIEIFYLYDRMLRVLWSNDQTVDEYCITVLRPGITFSTRDGFVIGRDKFSKLPTYYDEPKVAEWDFGNWSGSYVYEESGNAPTVVGGGYLGFFGFHGIQDFYGPNAIYSNYIPHYNRYSEPAHLQLKIVDALDERPTLTSTGRVKGMNGQTYTPPSFAREYENFRDRFSPDTFCSGGAVSFRQANQDLEEYDPNFRRFVKGQ